MELPRRGTVDDGARFRAAWQPLIDGQFKLARAEDRDEPHDAYAFDALIELAELAGTAGPDRPGDATRAAEAGEAEAKHTPAKYLAIDPPRLRSPGPRCGRG